MPKFITKEEQCRLEKVWLESYMSWRSEAKEFILFPSAIITNKEFTDGEIRFYLQLFRLSDYQKGILYHSNEKLAEHIGCSENNVKHFLKLLKKKQAIEVLSTGIHNKRVICLTPQRLL
jgi:biotin operon repressor